MHDLHIGTFAKKRFRCVYDKHRIYTQPSCVASPSVFSTLLYIAVERERERERERGRDVIKRETEKMVEYILLLQRVHDNQL